MDEIWRNPGMETVHLHQVWPLQRYTQVQAAGFKPNSHDSRVLHLHAQRYGGIYVAEKQQYFGDIGHYFIIISYLCTQIVTMQWHCQSYCLANVHPQYSYWKLKRRASVLYTRIWKIQNKQTRRSTTVHVYTWACRLMVFLQGFPEPECRDVGTTAHVSCFYQTA